jgi:hypothetical protein
VSIGWNAGSGVNRYFADESLPAREAMALKAFARRDPKTWLSLALNVAVIGTVVLWFVWTTPLRQNPSTRGDVGVTALVVFAILSLAAYLQWEWSVSSRVRKLVTRQAQVGALLTSSFGPRALRITTPDIGYEIPYASITHIRRFGDVLVVKPNNHLVMALPMELVPPRDLALIESKVANRSMREASAS